MKISVSASATNVKAFLVLHRTPSEIIDTDIDFQSVAMFGCDELATDTGTGNLCPYEATPIMKYCSTDFAKKFDPPLHHVSKLISMSTGTEKGLLRMYSDGIREWFDRNGDGRSGVYALPAPENEQLVDKIACNYIKQNGTLYHRWIDSVREYLTLEILLGTFYPNSDENKAENIGKYKTSGDSHYYNSRHYILQNFIANNCD